MSKSVATESNEGHESHKMGGKRGAEDEENEDGFWKITVPAAANSTTLTTVSAAPAAVDDFLATADFRRLLVCFAHDSTLMNLRFTTKAWKAVAEEVIDDGVASDAMMIHDWRDFSWEDDDPRWDDREEMRKLVTRVVFLLNIKKVGNAACDENLIVVDIYEGVKSIGMSAFRLYCSLTTVSFPATLTSICGFALNERSSLDNVDILHTNLQELGDWAFGSCSELTSMTIPDSLQTFGTKVFENCVKLVPSNIIVNNDNVNDVTSEVVAHLRSKQSEE